MKQFKHINQVLGVERLESVKNKVSLNEDQLNDLNRALVPVDTYIEQTGRYKAEKQKIQSKISEIYSALNTIDPLVAAQETIEKKIDAVRALLAAKPGLKLNEDLTTTDLSLEEHLLARDLDGVDWATIDNLDHNHEADSIIYEN